MLLLMLQCLIAAVLLLLAVHTIILHSSRNTNIPSVPGVPVLGNAIALGKGGLSFITQCRQRFGDTFCLHVFGQRMVFVFDPACLTLFFKAPEASISFKPAVEQFTQRIYGLPSREFFSKHEALLATLRQLLVPAQLDSMGRQLLQTAQEHLQQHWLRPHSPECSEQEHHQIELWSACQGLVFAAAGQVLFGAPFFKRHGLQAVQQAFLDFEGNFEIAASPVPHLLLPRFRRSRKTLLTMLAASLAAGDFNGTVVEQLLQGCGLPERLWPNLLLAVLWASQANSMPAMFWSLALLLLPEHAEARAKVLQELRDTAADIKTQQQQQQQQQQTAPGQPQEGPQQEAAQQQQQQEQQLDESTVSAMLALSLDKRSWVSRCVAEAIRLRLHSIAVRFVSDSNLVLPSSTTNTNTNANTNTNTNSSSTKGRQGGHHHHQQQQQQVVPRGSILCICPIESHHDPRLYPEEPWAFKPDREAIQGLAPGTVVPGVAGMGFGGGFWRCPGRFFAEMELALMLQLVLLQLELVPLPSHQQQQQQDVSQGGADPAVNHHHHQQQPNAPSKPRLPPAVAKLLPGWVQQALLDAAVFGLGGYGGSSRQEQGWLASGGGEPVVQLPRCELKRLVGFKVPAEPWLVVVKQEKQEKLPAREEH